MAGSASVRCATASHWPELHDQDASAGPVDLTRVGRVTDSETVPGPDDPLTEALLRAGRHLRGGEVSADLRTITKRGGREADSFYRDRWSYDKVVRSTHGVNCTGSCSWKVYVKDGIITWESQQTDYPSVGAG